MRDANNKTLASLRFNNNLGALGVLVVQNSKNLRALRAFRVLRGSTPDTQHPTPNTRSAFLLAGAGLLAAGEVLGKGDPGFVGPFQLDAADGHHVACFYASLLQGLGDFHALKL